MRDALKTPATPFRVEGVGGPLTEPDSEESPLSVVQMSRTSGRSETIRSMQQKRTLRGVNDDVEGRRFPRWR